jgi:hypothetical protein
MNPNTGPSRPKKSRNEEWRIKMEKMIEECRQAGPREMAAKIARGAGESPLTDDILSATKPKRFTVPAFQKYDGTTDPVDHIRGYKQVMRIETSDEKLMCKIFPTSLMGSAAKWFQDLKPQSISSLDELTRVFVSKYFYSREQKKDMAALFCTKQNVGEKIGKFFERFKAEMRGINCEPQYAAIAFREGLLPETALYRNLIRNPPKNMDDVLTRVEGEIRLEKASEAQEARFTAAVTSREPRRNSREMESHGSRERNSRGERSEDHPLREWFTASPVHIYKQHSQEGIFKKPPP